MEARHGLAALEALRSDEAWFSLADFEDEEEIERWRALGFTPESAAAWLGVAPALDDRPETAPRLALSWLAAGLAPVEASQWTSALLGTHEPDVLARTAQEWIHAGFAPDEARDWGQEVSIEFAAASRAAGWSVWQALLHLEWLRVHDTTYVDAMWHLLHPADAIADARAGLSPGQLAEFEARRRSGTALAELLPWVADVERSITPWVRCRLEQLVDLADIPPDHFAGRPLIDQEIAPIWDLSDPWPATVPPPSAKTWSVVSGDRWAGVEVPPFDLGCPEDFAYEPEVEWTRSQEEALAQAIEAEVLLHEEAGTQVAVYLEWPPEAGLKHPSHASLGDQYGCMDHDLLRRDCEECLTTEAPVLRLEPAIWGFSLFVQCETTDPLGDGHITSDRVLVLELSTDPRSIRYSEGPLR